MPTIAPRKGGHAPYGWRWEGRALVEDETEQHIRWLILHMAGLGYSERRITGELHTLAIPARDGSEVWPKTTLRRVIVTARAQLADTG